MKKLLLLLLLIPLVVFAAPAPVTMLTWINPTTRESGVPYTAGETGAIIIKCGPSASNYTITVRYTAVLTPGVEAMPLLSSILTTDGIYVCALQAEDSTGLRGPTSGPSEAITKVGANFTVMRDGPAVPKGLLVR